MSIDHSTATVSNGHAALMDRMYRKQRYIYDLTRKYYLLGRDRTISRLNVPKGGSILEVGCGTGRNLLLTHRLFPEARLYGLDISVEMLSSTRNNFRGRAIQPVLRAADATDFTAVEFATSGFDRIMISYSLSMIPDWEKAIDAALTALNPGGSLHIVDFGQQEKLPAWFRSMLHGWLARFHVSPRATLREVLEKRCAGQGLELEFETICRGYAWRAVVTR